MKRLIITSLFLLFNGIVRADYVIHSDKFSRQGLLHNSQPDQSASRWVADGAWTTDGSKAKVMTQSRLAFLPFKPHPDNLYTLSMRVECVSGEPASEWMACGFAKGMKLQEAWNVINNPTGWMLLRALSNDTNQLQTFPGGNAGVFNGSHKLTIILDTRPTPSSNWIYKFKVDDVTVRGPVAAADAAAITSVGIGNSGGLGWVDDFSLTSLMDDRPAELADAIITLTPPMGGATSLILPSVEAGYQISVKNSNPPGIISHDGKITTPVSDTTVTLTLTIIGISSGQSADTKQLKVFVPAARTSPRAATYVDNFRLRRGLFLTWTSMPDGQGNPVVFSDGSRATTMDQFANSADVNAVVEQAALFGFDHVVLMDFHGAGTTLHPCAALDNWRGPGFTSQRDLIGEMIAAFNARNIKVYLMTHPGDGHDYSEEQQRLLGFNDPTGNYKKWNDFINDVHAEIVERYGNDIVGIDMDSEFGMSSDPRWVGKLDLPRLRATILSRKPGLSLSALAGPNDTCEFGLKEIWRPSWLDPWMSRAETDYNVETWPAYRRTVAVVQSYHWATVLPPAQGVARLTGRQMFRYSVLQAAAGTEGSGVQWAASPYTDGTWENGVAEAFADLIALVQPVAESLRNVYPSTSYLTREGTFLRDIAKGIVATKKTDDSVEYIHVMNPPAGKVLTLPPPADGKTFVTATLLANGHTVQLQQNAAGLRLTLGAGDSWNPDNTVIKLVVNPAARPPRNLALHGYVSSSSSIENGGGLGLYVAWGRIRLVDGRRGGVASPVSWSTEIHGWSSKTSSANAPTWVQVDLGVSQQIDKVTLYPRNEAGNIGYGFPVTFKILASSDGIAWDSVASVANLPLPTGPKNYRFTPRQARYVRVAATVLRSNPNDANRFALQFAEFEVFGPASSFTLESSMNLSNGFADKASAFIELDR